jgi:redox-sensitive bicupin YhaK (pirin superfamily)
VIAGELAGHQGPGSTWTPISYAHATLSPGARLHTPWKPEFNALVYVLSGSGMAGEERRPLREGQLAVFGPGDAISVQANAAQDTRSPSLEVLLLGGLPIGEPTVFYGPFVMNTRDEIVQAIADYRAGRMGTIPPEQLRGRA